MGTLVGVVAAKGSGHPEQREKKGRYQASWDTPRHALWTLRYTHDTLGFKCDRGPATRQKRGFCQRPNRCQSQALYQTASSSFKVPIKCAQLSKGRAFPAPPSAMLLVLWEPSLGQNDAIVLEAATRCTLRERVPHNGNRTLMYTTTHGECMQTCQMQARPTASHMQGQGAASTLRISRKGNCAQCSRRIVEYSCGICGGLCRAVQAVQAEGGRLHPKRQGPL